MLKTWFALRYDHILEELGRIEGLSLARAPRGFRPRFGLCEGQRINGQNPLEHELVEKEGAEQFAYRVAKIANIH